MNPPQAKPMLKERERETERERVESGGFGERLRHRERERERERDHPHLDYSIITINSPYTGNRTNTPRKIFISR